MDASKLESNNIIKSISGARRYTIWRELSDDQAHWCDD